MEDERKEIELKEKVISENKSETEKLEEIQSIIDKDKKLNLKTIQELLGESFNIPSYQRGYRWKKQQVEDLLKDIEEFAKKTDKHPDEFYCLQPIVVMANGGKWDVIDGQQRLTTIYLILKYLGGDNFAKLEYETRGSESFLEEITPKTESDTIDEYHFVEAFKVINDWFNGKDKDRWKENLLKKTKVIWYEVKGESAGKTVKDSIDAFMRLNSGKISLTNSEMIRALFLLNCFDKDKDSTEMKLAKQQKLATEWDNLERELQNNDFWGFITLNNPVKKDYPNHIEYLFDLIEDGDKKDQEDKYSTYRMYEKKLKNANNSVEECWLEVKQLYWRFHEWYIDDEIYHYLGYLWLVGGDEVKTALVDSSKSKQSDFIENLKTKIAGLIFSWFKAKKGESIDLLCLSYLEDKDKIQKILKLFNVYTHMQEKTRCPFRIYKRTQWSLEHIHAQNSEDLDGEKWKAWADTQIFNNDELQKLLQDWNEDQGNQAKIKTEFESKLASLFGDITSDMHTLKNMALLGKSANSALGNKIFPLKRDAVLGFIENGSYAVPLATKNVFLKYYSKDIVQMQKWGKEDCNAYGNAIEDCIKSFVNVPSFVGDAKKESK